MVEPRISAMSTKERPLRACAGKIGSQFSPATKTTQIRNRCESLKNKESGHGAVW